MKILYELKCENCGEVYEVLCEYDQLHKILTETKCQECGGPLYKVPAFAMGQFKGSGFTKRSC